jgi:hypothetical protein
MKGEGTMSYQCSTCGKLHDGLPDIGDDKPFYWYTIPEEERAARSMVTEDTCVIDGEEFFIRGVIHIPINDYDQDFGFGVWVSQKKENFQTYIHNFDTNQIGPFFGWLSSELTYFEESTLSLKTMAHFVGNGQRPSIELEPATHPLAIFQQEGITLAKAWEIVHFYMGTNNE